MLFLLAAVRLALTLTDSAVDFPTPPMGWNSWNHYHCAVNEHILRNISKLYSKKAHAHPSNSIAIIYIFTATHTPPFVSPSPPPFNNIGSLSINIDVSC